MTNMNDTSPMTMGSRPNLWRHWALRIARRMKAGRLTIVFPDGGLVEFEGATPGPAAIIEIRRWRLLYRLLLGGDLGFAESYIDGDWVTPDLDRLLSYGLLNLDDLQTGAAGVKPLIWIQRLRHRLRANTRRGSRRNIALHYDLGNAFFKQWLDESMSYSAGLFSPAAPSLDAAQAAKYHRIAKVLDLHPGDRVLEIGCGWGGFAEIAARDYGCHVTGLTLSREQAAYARERARREGLADRIEIRLQDYRDSQGQFDKIASIEMFEAVGEENWPLFFEVLKQRLAPSGRAALQVITIADERFESYRRSVDYIQQYIFPGGMLPSPTAFATAVQAAGLDLRESFFFGPDYARTLHCWSELFEARWDAISQQGFDERFRRMWRYYLSYCRQGFEAGCTDVGHFLLQRP